jgi:hypothetical protein
VHGVTATTEILEPATVQPAEASTTLVSSQRTLSVLRRGADIVRRAVAAGTPFGAGHHQVVRVVQLSQRITWAYTVGNAVYAADRSNVTTDVQVAVIEGAPPATLNRDATFQAHQGDDGFPRIYVQPRRYTVTWAGIVLFHWLGRVLEHLEGVTPLGASGEDWWNAEARAYHRDALIIDAVSGGRLLPALAGVAASETIPDLLGRDPDKLSDNLYWQAFGGRSPDPPKSTPERWARSASLIFGAVVATHAHPVSLADLSESSAGPELRQAATAWGFSPVDSGFHRPEVRTRADQVVWDV